MAASKALEKDKTKAKKIAAGANAKARIAAARSRPPRPLPRSRLHLTVLQNGAPQVTASIPLRGLFGRSVRVGNSVGADLRVPFAQLPARLRVFRVSRRGASVYIDPRFEGFVNDGSRFGTVREFIAPRGSLSDLATVLEPLEVKLHNGARGLLRFADYEILFRLDAREDKPKVAVKAVGAGSGAFALPAANHALERHGIFVGVAATLAVFLPLTLWLLKAPYEEIAGLANLPEEYAMQLVHPDHYKVLPIVFRERVEKEDPTHLAIEWIDALRKRWSTGKPNDDIPVLGAFPLGGSDLVDTEAIERRARQSYAEFHQERERNKGDRYFQVLKGYPRVLVDTAGGLEGSRTVRLVRDIQHLRRTIDALEEQSLEEQRFLMAHYKELGIDYPVPFSVPKILVITGPMPDEEFARERAWRDRVAEFSASSELTPLRARLLDWAVRSPGGRPSVVWLGLDGALSPGFLAGRLAVSGRSSENLIENARYATGLVEVPPAPVPKPVINGMDVDLLVYAKREELRSCYEAALRRSPKTGGEVQWQLEVDPKGVLRAAKVARTDIADREFLLCLQDRMKAWRFPPARGGIAVFRYPFRFRRGGQESR